MGRRGGDSIDRSIDRSVATRRSIGDSMDRVHGDGSRLVNFKKKRDATTRRPRGSIETATGRGRSMDRLDRSIDGREGFDRSIDRPTRSMDRSMDRSIDSMDDASRIARARCVLIDCRCDARGSRRRGACDRCRRPSREAMRCEATSSSRRVRWIHESDDGDEHGRRANANERTLRGRRAID